MFSFLLKIKVSWGHRISAKSKCWPYSYSCHRVDHNPISPKCFCHVPLPCVVSRCRSLIFCWCLEWITHLPMGPYYHFYFIFMELSDGNDAEWVNRWNRAINLTVVVSCFRCRAAMSQSWGQCLSCSKCLVTSAPPIVHLCYYALWCASFDFVKEKPVRFVKLEKVTHEWKCRTKQSTSF